MALFDPDHNGFTGTVAQSVKCYGTGDSFMELHTGKIFFDRFAVWTGLLNGPDHQAYSVVYIGGPTIGVASATAGYKVNWTNHADSFVVRPLDLSAFCPHGEVECSVDKQRWHHFTE